MAVVLGGLGQPERGSLAAFGLGAAESDPNAMRAALSGSCSITATLTGVDNNEPATATGKPAFRSSWVRPIPQYPRATPSALAAHLTGGSDVTASLDFTLDADWLLEQFAAALVLDIV